MHQCPCTRRCSTAPFAPNRAQNYHQRQSASWKRLPARAGGEQDRPVQERTSQEELGASSRPKPNPEGLKVSSCFGCQPRGVLCSSCQPSAVLNQCWVWNLQLQKVERLGEESWAGVAAVDRGTDGLETSVGCVLFEFVVYLNAADYGEGGI